MKFHLSYFLFFCTLPHLIGWGLKFILHHFQRQNASMIKYTLWVLEMVIYLTGVCLCFVSLKIVAVYIKNEEFDKAEEMLNKFFPKSGVDKVSATSCLGS